MRQIAALTCCCALLLLGGAGVARGEVVAEAGLGGAVLAANAGGESLTKHGVGPSIDMGLGWPVKQNLLVMGRVLAMSGIEDEAHAHDDLVFAAAGRALASPVWFELGIGLGFYRGRYRSMGFFSSDSAYDGETFGLTFLGGVGVTFYRHGPLALDAHANLTISPYGDEVPSLQTIYVLVGATWRPAR